MKIGETFKRGLGAISGRNIEVTAERMAEVHGEILLGMDKRLDSLERKVDAVPDPVLLLQRLKNAEHRFEADHRQLRRVKVLAVVAIGFSLLALIGVAIEIFGHS